MGVDFDRLNAACRDVGTPKFLRRNGDKGHREEGGSGHINELNPEGEDRRRNGLLGQSRITSYTMRVSSRAKVIQGERRAR